MSNGLGGGVSALIPNKKQEKAQKPTRVRRSVLGPQEQAAQEQTVVKDEAGSERILRVDVNVIDPNPMQPRTSFGHEAMEDLVNSIKEHGIIEPLIATREAGGRYQLIAGERRLRASKILGLETVPVILRTAQEVEKLELSLIENIQRHDLNPMEVAGAYGKLIEEFGMTQEELAKKIGKSRSVVANSLRLLSLPSEVKKALADFFQFLYPF